MPMEDSPENVQSQPPEAPAPEVPPPEPLAPEVHETVLTADDRQWGMFCHLSALLGLLVGGLTFLGPLVCWLMQNDQSKFVDYHGKEAMNFHLNILTYGVILVAITVVTWGCAGIATVPLLIALGVYAIVMPILAGLQANEGKYYVYPATFRMIK